MVDQLAPTVSQLVAQLMPWLSLSPAPAPSPSDVSSPALSVSDSLPSSKSLFQVRSDSPAPVVLPVMPASAPLRVLVPKPVRGGAPAVEPVSSITVSPSMSLVGFWRDSPVFADFLMAMHASLTPTPSGCPVFQPNVVGLKPGQWAISTTSLRIWAQSTKTWDVWHLFTMPEIPYLQMLSIVGNVYFIVRK